jgi:NTE family protein
VPDNRLLDNLSELSRRLLKRLPRPHDRTAFVLSGGGIRGALQVGMLRALLEQRIVPDLIVGCSVGALNGAAVAEEPTLARVGALQDLWLGLDSSEIFPSSLLPTTVQLALRGEALHGSGGLRAVAERVLAARSFEELTVPFQCVATDIVAADERWFDAGPLLDPILASAALPAVFPAVEIDGVRYMDGAVVNDVPVTRAVELGATRIYVLHVGSFDRPRPEPKRPLDVALMAYWIARRYRFRRDLARIPDGIEVTVLPTGETPEVRYSDLTHSGELIDIAYRASADFLTGRSDPTLPVTSQPAPEHAAPPPPALPAEVGSDDGPDLSHSAVEAGPAVAPSSES